MAKMPPAQISCVKLLCGSTTSLLLYGKGKCVKPLPIGLFAIFSSEYRNSEILKLSDSSRIAVLATSKSPKPNKDLYTLITSGNIKFNTDNKAINNINNLSNNNNKLFPDLIKKDITEIEINVAIIPDLL